MHLVRCNFAKISKTFNIQFNPPFLCIRPIFYNSKSIFCNRVISFLDFTPLYYQKNLVKILLLYKKVKTQVFIFVGTVVYLMNQTFLLKNLKIEFDHEDLDVFLGCVVLIRILYKFLFLDLIL